MLYSPIRALRRSLKARRGLSILLLTVLIAVLACFLAFAVDIGRMKVCKAQLQTAADAAAIAGVRELKFMVADGIERAEEAAIDTAAENVNLDQNVSNQGGMRHDASVVMQPIEDVEFGVWRPDTREFELVEDYGGETDDRKRANAVRTWGRRVTTFEREDMLGGTHEITRNDGLPLIFGPFFSVFNGEIQTKAVAYISGGAAGTFGFVGLESVKFNGTTKSDSYTSAIETYPGTNGANQNGGIASNGDVTLVGNTQIWGDVRPGENANIMPIPLGDNVEVTGYMHPLEKPLVYVPDAYTPPTTQPYNANGSIVPANAINGQRHAPKGKNNVLNRPGSQVGDTTYFWFSSWTSGSQDEILIDNSDTHIKIWIDGNLKNGGQAIVRIKDNSHKVYFYCNGNFDMQGGGLVNEAALTPAAVKPETLYISLTGTNTSFDIGGNPTMGAHIYAPGSDMKFHGNGQGTNGFWGWAIGKSLTVNGNFELHYDETRAKEADKTYKFRLVD